MFLNQLNQEQKVAFLHIAHHFAWSNNNFSEDEERIIKAYTYEMNIDDIDFNKNNFNLDEALNAFKDKESQKIVFLETMALALSDTKVLLDHLDEEERVVIDAMMKKFDISEPLARVFGNWSKAVIALTIQGQQLIKL